MSGPDRRRWLLPLALVLLALVTRAVAMALQPMPPFREMVSDDGAYYQIAVSLLERGEFLERHLRAYRPPGYPAVLAVYLALFGENHVLWHVLQNLVCLAAIGVFAFAVGRSLGTMVGVACAFLLLLNLNWLFLAQEANSETVFALLLAGAVALYAGLLRRPRWRTALLCGALFGLAALTREVGLYLGLAAAVAAGWTLRDAGHHRAFALAGTLAAGVLLVVAPWTVRNYVVLGIFVPVTTNSAINLYMGNHPEATGAYGWRLPERAQAIWNQPDENGSNEAEAYRLARDGALAHMREHPGRTAALAVTKTWRLWGPGPVGPWDGSLTSLYRLGRLLFWPPFFLLGLWGCWLLRRHGLGRLVLGALVLGTLLHVLTYGEVRYRAPYEFLLAAPAAAALLQLAARRKRSG